MKKLQNTLTVAFLLLSMLLLSGCGKLGDATRVDKEYIISNNGSISIDLNVVDVSVGLSTDDKVYITYYEYDLVKYEIDASDTKLVLTQHIDDKLHGAGKIIPITINIPEAFIGQFDIKDNVGNITVKNIAAKNINLDSNVGDIKLSQQATLTAENITINSDTGDITVENTTAKSINLSGKTGDITVENITAENISLTCKTGDITGSIIGASGDFSITSSTTVGKNNLPNGTTGAKKLNVTTKVGDIKISFTK